MQMLMNTFTDTISNGDMIIKLMQQPGQESRFRMFKILWEWSEMYKDSYTNIISIEFEVRWQFSLWHERLLPAWKLVFEL